MSTISGAARPAPTATLAPPANPFAGIRRLVLATDAGHDDAGAIRLAAELARRKGAEVSVVTVAGPRWGRRRLTTVRRRLVDVLGDAPPWPVEVVSGQSAPAIAEYAETSDADLIAVGCGRRRVLEHALSRETALDLARMLTVPMIAVPRSAARLPRGVVVGVDVGQSAVWAARLALAAAEPDAPLYLVHVRRPFLPRPVAEELLAEVEDELGPAGAGRLVHRAVLEGEPAAALLAYVESVGADLVALGNREHTRVERILVGTTAAGVVRRARCAVLL